MSILEVKNLSVQYHTGNGEKQVLDRVSFFVEKGEIAGIVGESGSGKSTAVLAVTGLLGKVRMSCQRRLTFAASRRSRDGISP